MNGLISQSVVPCQKNLTFGAAASMVHPATGSKIIAEVLKHDTYFLHQTHQQNGQILRPGDVLVLPRNVHQK
ncbi:hypothetical protein YC2023_005549 [Brassica napus]